MNEKEKVNREFINPSDEQRADMRTDFITGAIKAVNEMAPSCEAAIVIVENGDGIEAMAYGETDKLAAAILSLVEATPTIRRSMMKLKYMRMMSSAFDSVRETDKDGTH